MTKNVLSIKEILCHVDLSDESEVDFNNIDEYDQRQLSVAYKSFLKLYFTLEFMVSQTLDFNTVCTAPLSFLSVFQQIAVTEMDIKVASKCKDLDVKLLFHLKVCVNEILKTLSDIFLTDIYFSTILSIKSRCSND